MSGANYICELAYDKPLDDNSYLSALPVIRHLTEHKNLSFQKSVTFFVGENGTGKSTLLEAIAVAFGFNPEGGTIHFRFSTNQTHSELYKHITLGKKRYPQDGFFLRAESLYNAATYIDTIWPPVVHSYGGVSLHRQSHGESFLSIVQHRFSGKGLYIMDEPEAALSPMRLLTLLAEMDRLVKNDSQLIIATHSPILLAFPDADIWEFSENGIRRTAYQDTEHYKITKLFLDDPQRMLHHLFNP